jgi:hypothetical protein
MSTKPASPPSWRIDFKIYKRELPAALWKLYNDKDYLEQKKQSTDDVIDWKHTFNQQLSHPYNLIKKL